jgi:hypothetical protein
MTFDNADELRKIARRARTQTGINDDVAEREEEVKREFAAAIAQERKVLAGMRGNVGGEELETLRRLDALRIDQGLHRNGAPQVGVPRCEDETHAPAAQLALDLETTQGRGRGRVRIGE